jgi:hypothetical protein
VGIERSGLFLVDRAPDVLADEFETRFRNWLRWCRDVYGSQGRCFSAEGAYRSPQHWDPPEPNMRILEPIMDYDALLVNRAYWQLAEKTRRTIKILWFRTNWKPTWQAQKIGCHHTELGEVGYRAKRMLQNRLDFVERKHRIAV